MSILNINIFDEYNLINKSKICLTNILACGRYLSDLMLCKSHNKMSKQKCLDKNREEVNNYKHLTYYESFRTCSIRWRYPVKYRVEWMCVIAWWVPVNGG